MKYSKKNVRMIKSKLLTINIIINYERERELKKKKKPFYYI